MQELDKLETDSSTKLYKCKKVLYDIIGWTARNTFYTKRGGATRWRRILTYQPNGKRK